MKNLLQFLAKTFFYKGIYSEFAWNRKDKFSLKFSILFQCKMTHVVYEYELLCYYKHNTVLLHDVNVWVSEWVSLVFFVFLFQ